MRMPAATEPPPSRPSPGGDRFRRRASSRRTGLLGVLLGASLAPLATLTRLSTLAGLAGLAGLPTGCAAIYPERATPVREPIAGQILQPPPQLNFVWVAIEEGEVPPKTRDGRRWRDSKSGAPNPFAIVFVNGRELLRTRPRSDTYRPRWDDAPRGNFRFNAGDRVRVELWDSALIGHPICVREIGPVSERWAEEGRVDARCDDGARVTLRWEPAHGRYGYGFSYEFRTYDVFVSRVSAESPAARAGLRVGDQIVSLGGRSASSLKSGELQSYLNAPRGEGVTLGIRRADGSNAEISLKEGAIYPLFSEVGTLP
ncbi:MAG: PDZ domain-containing protein [Polyangiaceae bacterium]|nr:PDZ domain-containing protein [Polyangiaceae bacterium]